MMGIRRCGVAALLLTLGCVGCNRPQRSHYTVRDRSVPVAVRADDLGMPASVGESIGVRQLGGDRSVGRFPAAICVARVVAREGPDSQGRHLLIADFSAHHKVYWNQLLDEQPAVREVLFLTDSGLDPRGYDRNVILKAAKGRGADLCVLYARVPTPEADAAYMGALWDVRDMQPLLGLRSAAVLPDELAVELAAQRDEDNVDPSVREADFRAEQDFRRMFRDAVWDLVKSDPVAPPDEQNPWRGYVPQRDRPWRGLQDLFGPFGD